MIEDYQEILPTNASVGVLDVKLVARRKSKIKSYRYWTRMLDRCYRTYDRVCYKNCKVSEGFKVFSSFDNWCKTQKGFLQNGFELDKDLLGDSHLYSEETCCFIPKAINSLITNKVTSKGKFPTGVSFYKRTGLFKADCMYKGKKKHLGYFDNPEEAFISYKKFKEAYVKEVALEWKDMLDNHVFEALLLWEVKK